jgi:hypothetical protein
MIKVGTGSGNVIVLLSNAEFKVMAGSDAGNVPDGTDISLLPVKNKIDLVDSKTAELAEIKTLSASMVQKLTEIGI